MTAPVVRVEHQRQSAFFAGELGLVHAAIKIVGCRKQYDARRRAVSVPRQHADDVAAALEFRFGVDVQPVSAIT